MLTITGAPFDSAKGLMETFVQIPQVIASVPKEELRTAPESDSLRISFREKESRKKANRK